MPNSDKTKRHALDRARYARDKAIIRYARKHRITVIKARELLGIATPERAFNVLQDDASRRRRARYRRDSALYKYAYGRGISVAKARVELGLPPKKSFTENDRACACELVLVHGWEVRKVALRYGIDRGTIYRWLWRNGAHAHNWRYSQWRKRALLAQRGVVI